MTRHLVGLMTAAALVASCDTRQPAIGCPVQGVEWVATYKPVGTNTCPERPGELLGVQAYTQPSGEQHLALKPQTLNDMDPADMLDRENPPYALGVLSAKPDADGFCTVSPLSLDSSSLVAEKHVLNVSKPSLPTDAAYHWSNVRLVALLEAPGKQLIADLEYTATYSAKECTARYEVWAMWPGDVDCEDKGSPGKPDDSICQESKSIPPSFAVTCDPVMLRCVPAQRPPSLRSTAKSTE
jgi:hypothetical protein